MRSTESLCTEPSTTQRCPSARRRPPSTPCGGYPPPTADASPSEASPPRGQRVSAPTPERCHSTNYPHVFPQGSALSTPQVELLRRVRPPPFSPSVSPTRSAGDPGTRSSPRSATCGFMTALATAVLPPVASTHEAQRKFLATRWRPSTSTPVRLACASFGGDPAGDLAPGDPELGESHAAAWDEWEGSGTLRRGAGHGRRAVRCCAVRSV